MAELPRPRGESSQYWSDDESDDDVTKERNKKRRKISFVIDKGNPPVRNIIIPLPQLVSFLMNTFICRNC
jgi:hypothetical protein